MTTQLSSAAVAAELSSGALAGTWTLDPAASNVKLATKAMFGIVPVKGTFNDVSGQAEVTPAGAVSAVIDIASASINTKMKKRDTHLRSDDFFASEQHPHISVTISSVAATGETLTATGSVTLRDQSMPLSFPLSITTMAGGAVELDAEVTIDRSELGLGFKKMGATKMANTLTMHAVFHRA